MYTRHAKCLRVCNLYCKCTFSLIVQNLYYYLKLYRGLTERPIRVTPTCCPYRQTKLTLTAELLQRILVSAAVCIDLLSVTGTPDRCLLLIVLAAQPTDFKNLMSWHRLVQISQLHVSTDKPLCCRRQTFSVEARCPSVHIMLSSNNRFLGKRWRPCLCLVVKRLTPVVCLDFVMLFRSKKLLHTLAKGTNCRKVSRFLYFDLFFTFIFSRGCKAVRCVFEPV